MTDTPLLPLPDVLSCDPRINGQLVHHIRTYAHAARAPLLAERSAMIENVKIARERAERAEADGKAAFDLSVECRARAVKAEAERDEHDRWLAEMCADYRLEADDHAVSRRLAINRLIHSLRAERDMHAQTAVREMQRADALKELLREARPVVVQVITFIQNNAGNRATLDDAKAAFDRATDWIARIDAALDGGKR